MMTPTPSSTPHLADDEILRYIDAEGSETERQRWETHLDACLRCQHETDTARNESRDVSRWLAAAAFEAPGPAEEPAPSRAPEAALRPAPKRAPVPASRPAPVPARKPALERWRVPRRPAAWRTTAAPWLKAAAILLLLAAPVAAIAPLRDWVGDRIAALVSRPVPPTAAPAATPVTTAAAVRFMPAPGTLAVVFDARQASGDLVVGRTTGAEAILEVEGDPAPEPVVSARMLRIANTSGTTVSYRLLLPPAVERVELALGDRQVTLEAADLDRATVIRLRD
jgi:anti-sigma factor RsiW